MEKHDEAQDEQKRDDPAGPPGAPEPKIAENVHSRTRPHPFGPYPRPGSRMPLRQFRARGRAPTFLQYGQRRAASIDILRFRHGIAGARRPRASPRPGPAMPPKPIRPPTNSATATSLAALSTVGAAPPASSARRASASAGKRSGSGSSKVSVPISARSSRGAGAVDALRPGQAMRDRDPHVGRAELRDHRAVAELDQAVDDRLRMHQHVELRRAQARTGDAPRSVRGPCSSWSRN